MAKIVSVPIGEVDPNPFRLTGEYPFSEKKLETLRRSIQDVGLWEGIIGRSSGNRVEIAFGHHRHKAALLEGLSHIPIILRQLTDEEMLKFMGRENMEDYNTNFLTLLETWEAAAKWCSVEHNSEQPTVIARLLGWTRSRTDSERDMLNEVAKACNSAHSLIKDGHLDRSDLTEMSVGAAREIVERAHARVAEIDKWAKENKITKSVAKKQKAHVSGAAKSVAKQVRGGTVSQRDIRQKVDLEAFSRQIKQDKAVPKFPNFGNALADQIQRMLSGDSADEKLTELAAVVHQATDPNDKRVIGRIVFELVHLEDRARVHKNRLENKGKVTPLRILPTGGGE